MEIIELYHYGTKGMRWGIRRYQNKDGSLTPAGQKRRDKLQAKLDKVTGADPKNTGKTRLKISDMTDEELGKYIARKRAEKDAYGLERDIANMNPKTVSAGKKFAQNFTEKALSPALAESGKKLLTGIMNKAIDKALGDGGAEEIAKLKKEAEKSGYMKQIAEANKAIRDAAKKPDDDMSALEKRAKEAGYEQTIANAEKAKHNARQSSILADKAAAEYREKYGGIIDNAMNNSRLNNTPIDDLPSYYNEDWDGD